MHTKRYKGVSGKILHYLVLLSVNSRIYMETKYPLHNIMARNANRCKPIKN